MPFVARMSWEGIFRDGARPDRKEICAASWSPCSTGRTRGADLLWGVVRATKYVPASQPRVGSGCGKVHYLRARQGKLGSRCCCAATDSGSSCKGPWPPRRIETMDLQRSYFH